MAPHPVVVTARTPSGAAAAFVLHNPPSQAEVDRLVGLASQPGLREAEWTCAPGDDPR